MNDLQIFNNEEFGEIRTITKDDKTYFAGSDVAKALGYAIPHKAVQTHCKGVLKWNIPTNSGSDDKMNSRTISDIEPIKRQCVYEDNKPCNSSCRYSNTCIHSANKTEE